MKELQDIMEAYERRDARLGRDKNDLVSLDDVARRDNLLRRQSFEREATRILVHYTGSLSGKKILDVGCGTGYFLRMLTNYGANPSDCYGVDLLKSRTDTVRSLNPAMNVLNGSAHSLEFKSHSFDIVYQGTVFSSILDRGLKQMVASEMLRLVKDDGMIVWYDYFLNNPKNKDVRGVGRREIVQLFPRCQIGFRRITLAPPIARRVAPKSLVLCGLLEKVPFLCTHYVAVIRRGQALAGVGMHDLKGGDSGATRRGLSARGWARRHA